MPQEDKDLKEQTGHEEIDIKGLKKSSKRD